MNQVFAMRRANGDWFALDDKGSLRVPVFHTASDAMLARSMDSGMECFRPVVLQNDALRNLTSAEQGSATYWFVGDPLRRLSLGRRLDRQELMTHIQNGGNKAPERGAGK